MNKLILNFKSKENKKIKESKKVVFDFFDNVIVNEEDQTIKKNRLELIQMLCKTFDYYVNFSLIDSHQ